MKRTVITAGVLGLGLISLTAPAMAAPDNVSLCHATAAGGYTSNTIDDSGLQGHDHHGNDIIPPNGHLPGGQNWDAAGIAIHAGGCVAAAAVVPPVVVPPVVVPVVVPPIVVPPVVVPPVVETPAVTPVVDTPAEVPAVVVEPPAAAPNVNPPAAAAPASGAVVVAAQPAAAVPQAAPRAVAAATTTTSLGTNQGYNAQTAVGGAGSSPAWLGGLGALVAAGAAVALRRRSGSSMAD